MAKQQPQTKSAEAAVSQENAPEVKTLEQLLTDGDTALAEKNYDAARDAFTAAAQLDPGNDEPLKKLSSVDAAESEAANAEIEKGEPKQAPFKLEKPSKAAVVSSGSEPMVNCRVIENHNCNIAGHAYNLRKEQAVSLPNSVAMILQRAGKVIKR